MPESNPVRRTIFGEAMTPEQIAEADRQARIQKAKRTRKNAIQLLFMLALIALFGYLYYLSWSDCAERNGVLVKGAWWFVCVDSANP